MNGLWQKARLLAQFELYLPAILDEMLSHYMNNAACEGEGNEGVSQGLPFQADLCTCGSFLRKTVQCRDCTLYESACEECYIRAHKNNPFHWAYVWDEENGLFNKFETSLLRKGTYEVDLGHGGNPCPHPYHDEGIPFTIIDINGVHSTRLRFCGCFNNVNASQASEMGGATLLYRVNQLLQARLFPATPTRPETAFTFAFLKHYQIMNLKAKASAHDFMNATRHITDAVFTAKVPVSVYNTCRSVQGWHLR